MVKITKSAEKKYKLIRLSLVLSVVLILFGLYFLNEIAADVRHSRTKVSEVERDIELLNDLQRDWRQNSNVIKEVKSTLPSEYYEISFFTTELEKLAENNNLTLSITIDNEHQQENETYSSITYNLEAAGSYSSISEFLSQMSKLPYHTSVDNLNISSGEENPVAKIQFRLFILK